MTKIFIVEDDIKIRQELSLFLERNGYDCEYSDDFSNIINIVLNSKSDLVLLDINLPYYDGHHICKEIRKISEVPIIVVTSQNSEIDELMSMNFGADDFVTKPYNTQILLARINSVIRRSSNADVNMLTHLDVTLNLSNSSVSHYDMNVELTKNEMRILSLLLEKKGEIISRSSIMESLWQSDEFVDDNTLTVNINRLRKKLETIGVEDFLKTKRGQGYMI